MQTMGVVGKIYNLKVQQGQSSKRATFRIGVRKEFVSDQDKQNNKVQTFMPMVSYGPTAEFIEKFFKDGDTICIKDMEYQTYRTQNAPNEYDDAHIFKVNKVGFVPGANDNSGGGNQSRSNNNNQSNNNNGGGYGGGNQGGGYGGGNQQPAGAGAGSNAGGGYQPSDDLPF